MGKYLNNSPKTALTNGRLSQHDNMACLFFLDFTYV
jgi:hypothetical protein